MQSEGLRYYISRKEISEILEMYREIEVTDEYEPDFCRVYTKIAQFTRLAPRTFIMNNIIYILG